MTANDAHSIPWKELVVPQILNFSLFAGLLIYLLRKPLQAHFAGKSLAFEQERKKAEESKVQAERQNFEVRQKLKDIEATTNSSLDDAARDAAAMKQKLIQEAKNQAARSEQEAVKMAEFEKIRAIAALKQELVLTATQQAEAQLKKDVDQGRQTKLNDEFIAKLRVAGT
jgi:F-type H+-transporting ATPase subunit b